MTKNKLTGKELSKKLVSILSSFDLDEVCPITSELEVCSTFCCRDCPFGSKKNFKKAIEGFKNGK